MPVESIHGRGAPRNATPTRFNLKERVAEGEWLDQVEALDGVPRRRTTVTVEHPRSILTRNSSPDVGFDRSVNAYRGCEHGCIYCFARPTHAFHDLSPGLDFETKLFAKPDAARILREELARPGYVVRPMAMGTNTDPYQPIEGKWRITDHEVENIVEAAAEAGATGAFFLPVRLPYEVAPLFRAWLDEHFPDRADKVMNIIRSMRGGKDNDPNWFTRMSGSGPWAELLRVRFEVAAKKHGLNREKKKLRCDLFVPPQGPQLRLL